MIFLFTFYLIGLYISALHRRNPCQKCEAFPAEWVDENILNKLLYVSHKLRSKLIFDPTKQRTAFKICLNCKV